MTAEDLINEYIISQWKPIEEWEWVMWAQPVYVEELSEQAQ